MLSYRLTLLEHALPIQRFVRVLLFLCLLRVSRVSVSCTFVRSSTDSPCLNGFFASSLLHRSPSVPSVSSLTLLPPRLSVTHSSHSCRSCHSSLPFHLSYLFSSNEMVSLFISSHHKHVVVVH